MAMNNQKKSVNQNNFMIRSTNKLKLNPEKENEASGKEFSSSPAKQSVSGREVPASKYLSPVEFN